MTGPEHYREAERLLDVAGLIDTDESNERFCLAAAQIHATLALAAAVVATRAIGPQEPWGGHAVDVAPEWQAVTS